MMIEVIPHSRIHPAGPAMHSKHALMRRRDNADTSTIRRQRDEIAQRFEIARQICEQRLGHVEKPLADISLSCFTVIAWR